MVAQRDMLRKGSHTLQKYSHQCEEQSDKYDRATNEYDFTQEIRAHQVGGMDVALRAGCAGFRRLRGL